MAFELVQITQKTRGVGSREIVFNGVGRYEKKVTNKETEEFTDTDGEVKTRNLGKDADGKQITRQVEVKELVTDGVLTDLDDLRVALLPDFGNDEKKVEQFICDAAARGVNEMRFEALVNVDELTPYLSGMSEDDASTFRRAVNAAAKTPMFAAFSKSDIAEVFLGAKR